MFLRSVITVALFSFIFCSCEKDDVQSQLPFRLKTIKVATDSAYDIYFVYDSQNRLAAFQDSTEQGYVTKTSIQYNLLGNPFVFVTSRVNDASVFYRDSLEYNGSLQVTKKFRGPYADGTLKISHRYSYDLNGRLLTDSAYYFDTQNLLTYTKFVYDANDNIVKTQLFSATGQQASEVNMTYDSNINPFKGLGWIPYFLGRPDLPPNLPSKNNVLTRNFHDIAYPGNDYKESFSYEYRTGVLQKILRKVEWNNNGGVTIPIDLIYE